MREMVAAVSAFFVVLAGCTPGPTFRSHSYEVMTTDADMGRIRSAIDMTHQSLGNWVEYPNGSRTDSSFSQRGKSWKDTRGRVEATRVRTEFESKEGIRYAIEDIGIPGEPRIILLSSDDDNATMQLHNEFVTCLGKVGVKAVKK